MILSQIAFALGACGGLARILMPSPEYGVEGGGELASAIPDQEPDRTLELAEVHQEVTRRLRRPRAVGVRGDPGQVDAAGAVLDDDQGV